MSRDDETNVVPLWDQPASREVKEDTIRVILNAMDAAKERKKKQDAERKRKNAATSREFKLGTKPTTGDTK